MRSSLHYLGRLFVVQLLALSFFVAPFARAAYNEAAPGSFIRVSYTPTGGTVVAGGLNEVSPAAFGRVWNAALAGGVATGDVVAADAVKATVGTAGEVAMTASRTLPWSAVAKTVAGAAARLAGPVGVALTGYQVYSMVQQARMRPAGGGTIVADPGQSTQLMTCFLAGNQNSYPQTGQPCYSSANAAATAYVAWLNANKPGCNPGYGCSYMLESNTGNSLLYSSTTVIPNGGGTATAQHIQNNIAAPSSQKCPAYIDFYDSANSVAAGSAVGTDGKCRTGQYAPVTVDAAAALLEARALKASAVDALKDAVNVGVDPTPLASALSLAGPATATGPSTTSTTTPAGGGSPVTTTSTPTYNITYAGNSYAYNTSNTTNNGGTVTTTTTPAAADTKVCGLPGTPACKLDESGTPTWSDTSSASSIPDQLKTDDASKRDAAAASVQDPGFGWFGAPALAVCTPFEYPNHMGSLNPCGVVDDVRSVMAYLWPLVAAWIAFGMIRQTVSGGR